MTREERLPREKKKCEHVHAEIRGYVIKCNVTAAYCCENELCGRPICSMHNVLDDDLPVCGLCVIRDARKQLKKLNIPKTKDQREMVQSICSKVIELLKDRNVVISYKMVKVQTSDGKKQPKLVIPDVRFENDLFREEIGDLSKNVFVFYKNEILIYSEEELQLIVKDDFLQLYNKSLGV